MKPLLLSFIFGLSVISFVPIGTLEAAKPAEAMSASWIWSSADGPGDTWMCFTHELELDAVPAAVPATIAADSTYWLWINGEVVVEAGGLKRGPTPTGSYADRIDLAGHLKPGTNRIAALVWYYGISSSSHVDSGKGGFLLDAPIADLRSSSRWRVRPHPGFASRPPDAGAWKPLRFERIVRRALPPPPGSIDVLSESPVRFDAREDLPGWQLADAGDGWEQAVEKGVPPVAPWGELVSRPIPQFRISEPRNFVNDAEFQLPRSGPAALQARLPVNRQFLPRMRIVADAAGKEITLAYERGRRGVAYITREGEQEFETPAWSNGEFVTYQIPEGVEVLEIGYRETGFDTDLRGRFTSNDPRLNQLWEKSVRSVYINMREGHMDCPDRERSAWPACTADAGIVPYYVFDRRADTLMVKQFRELLAWQTSEGVMWGAVPSGRFQGTSREFPGQSLKVIAIAMPEHVRATGDSALAAELVPGVRRYLIESWEMDADGLPIPRPTNTVWGPGTAQWMDWGHGVDRRLFETTLYAWALEGLDFMREVAGLPEDPEVSSRQQSIAAAFDRVFWVEEIAAYRSPDFERGPDDRGNAVAVLTGLAPAHRRDGLIAVFQEVANTSLYTERFVVEAMFLLGEPRLAMERMLRRYEATIAHPYSTLPEHWGYGNNPDDHGWNHAYGAVPVAILARRVGGIRPVTPGYQEFVVQPQPAGLTEFEVMLPSIRGDIEVKWSETPGRGKLIVNCPPGANGVVDFPATQRWTNISAQGLTSDEENPSRFVVGPGTWSFESVAK